MTDKPPIKFIAPATGKFGTPMLIVSRRADVAGLRCGINHFFALPREASDGIIRDCLKHLRLSLRHAPALRAALLYPEIENMDAH